MRAFIRNLLKRDGTPVGLPVSSKSETAVNAAVDVFLLHPGLGQDRILYALTQRGLEPAVAWRLYQLVPMAFCHVMYRGSGISFASTYISYNADTDARVARSLASEPLYVAAVRAAEQQAGEPT